MVWLVDPPLGLGIVRTEYLSGPETVGAGANSSLTGRVQTRSALGDEWLIRFQFAPMRGALYEAFLGWVLSMRGGVNFTRMPFVNPDRATLTELGYTIGASEERWGLPWGDGQPWGNGRNWQPSPVPVPVAAAASFQASEVRLQNVEWGHKLRRGSRIGFIGHFGLYAVDRVIAPGRYSIWPSLRMALAPASQVERAHLDPVLAMTLAEPNLSGVMDRDLVAAMGCSLTLVEVYDYELREALGI